MKPVEAIDAHTVGEWTGREARALRRARRMSVRAFAARLGVGVRTVSKWEAGGTAVTPRPDMQAILDTALGTASHDEQQRFRLELAAGDGPDGPPTTSRQDRSVLDTPWGRLGTVISMRVADRGGAVDRRGFLIVSGSALTGVAAAWATTLGGEVAASPRGRRRVTTGMVELLDRRLDDLRHLDDVLGGGELTRAAEAEFHMLSRLADDAVYDDATGQRLFATLADAARLCGWLHFDAGHQSAAQTFYITALRASATANTVDVGANTLAFMAIQTYTVGSPRDAVTLATTALDRIGVGATPRVRAMLQARAGRALSKTGDRDGTSRFLDAARDTMTAGPTEDDPPWSYWFTNSEIDMLAGSAALDLGDPTSALAHFQAARSAAYLADGYVRDGVLYLTRAAEAHLALGDVDQACAVARDAWQQSISLDSTRPSVALVDFRSHLGPHSNTAAAREFLDLTA